MFKLFEIFAEKPKHILQITKSTYRIIYVIIKTYHDKKIKNVCKILSFIVMY